MYLPHHNARLTQVSGGGFSEDHDQPATGNAPEWTGDAEALVQEETVESTAGGELNLLKRTVLVIPNNLPVTIKADDSVTYTQAGASLSRRVRDVKRDDFLGTVKLHLWDQ